MELGPRFDKMGFGAAKRGGVLSRCRDVALDGDSTGSGGGSASFSICSTYQLSDEEDGFVNGDRFAWPPSQAHFQSPLVPLLIHLHACRHQNVLPIYIFIYLSIQILHSH